MVDVSTLGLASLMIRLLGSVLFSVVLYRQIGLLRRYNDDMNWLRILLIALTSVPFLFNFIAITNNFVRWQQGVQSETINNFAFMLSAVSSTATALILYLIYKNRQQ